MNISFNTKVQPIYSVATTENKKEMAKKFANLIGPTDPKLDREVREELITARVGLLIKASFFGNMATRLTLVNADSWCSTAATDGRNFYYNSRFIKLLRVREIEFLFGHEVLHCVYDHFGRRGDRDPQLWNIADDYRVNGDLVKYKIGEKITSVPCLFDTKFDDMYSEEIYDHLYKNAKKINISDLTGKLLDEHIDGEDSDGDARAKGDGNTDADGDADGEDSDGDGKGSNGRPKLSTEDRAQIRDEIKEAILAAAAACDNAGNLPAGVKRIIQDMTESKMDWRDLLRMQLESTIKTDFTWMRASRRGWHMDAIMPGMKPGEQIDICVSIDMSGSISQEQARDFISEVVGITNQFEQYRLHIWTFDTAVYNPEIFSSDDGKSVADYEINGGGGTSFECNWEFMKEQGIEPKKFIMFTDGYPYGGWCSKGDEDYCDTIFVVHGSKTIVAPFGQTCYYDEEK